MKYPKMSLEIMQELIFTTVSTIDYLFYLIDEANAVLLETIDFVVDLLNVYVEMLNF